MRSPLGGNIQKNNTVMNRITILFLILLSLIHLCFSSNQQETLHLRADSILAESNKVFQYAHLDTLDTKFNHQITIDQRKWKLFSNSRFGFEFLYPPELELRIGKREFASAQESDSSVILLGFHYSDSTSNTNREKFVALVTMYFSASAFDSIALQEGFVYHEVFIKEDTVGAHTLIDSTRWDISSRSGLNDAEYIVKNGYKGLRGDGSVGIYHKGGGYVGLAEMSTAFLVIPLSNQKNLVFSFYGGPTMDYEDEPPVRLSEVYFYKIFESIKFISE
jgi:hypothetical protein